MAEYVEKEALKRFFGCDTATKYGNKSSEQQANSYSTMYMYEIADWIDDAPTADVIPLSEIPAPPVTAHWDYNVHKDDSSNFNVTAKCSHCGWDWFSKDGVNNPAFVFSMGGFVDEEAAPNYVLAKAKKRQPFVACPKCGAAMKDTDK